MTSKKPRICEHEERQISRHLISMVFTIENLKAAKYDDLWNEQKDAADDYASKITNYLNTKKPCTRCAKKNKKFDPKTFDWTTDPISEV